MAEMGRPISPQEVRYRQVEMGPKALNTKGKSEAQIREEIINKAAGQKNTKSIYKDGPHNEMGKDEFLKLLTYQLQNQDPMNPMEQSKFTGELAQFSQLEQLSNLNKKFDQANKTQTMQDKFYAASFVGKKIVTQGSSLDLKQAGAAQDVLFKLDHNASKVVIRVLDDKNNIAGEIWRDGMSHGSHQVTWDGMQLDGAPAPKGIYKVQVKAWDDRGQNIVARTEATGVVESVTFDEGEPVLTVNGQKVYLRDVRSFHTENSQTHTSAINSDLSGVNNPMVQSRVGVPTQQAMNAYEENAGIYD
jgi:flagellar basal-body rod modification protein FlgD